MCLWDRNRAEPSLGFQQASCGGAKLEVIVCHLETEHQEAERWITCEKTMNSLQAVGHASPRFGEKVITIVAAVGVAAVSACSGENGLKSCCVSPAPTFLSLAQAGGGSSLTGCT